MQKRIRVYFDNQNLDTLSLRQNGRHFANDIFKLMFLYENFD